MSDQDLAKAAAPAEQQEDGGRQAAITPQHRAEMCRREVAQVLQRHGCDIVAFLAVPEPVGERVEAHGGYGGMLVRAKVAIVPI